MSASSSSCALIGALLLATASPAAGAAATKVTVECTTAVSLYPRARKRGRPVPVAPGATIEVGERSGRWTKVRAGKNSGWIDSRLLDTKCAPPAPPEPTAAAAPETTEVTAATPVAPPVEMPPEVTRVAIAVLDLADQGAGAQVVGSLAQAVTAELAGLGPFTVISSDEIRQMLSVTATKQMMGCDDVACIAEIGGALGARYILSGSVGKLEGQVVLNLKLMDMQASTVVARESRQLAEGSQTLIADARFAARSLVRSLLDAASGFLVIRLNEEGANIELNDKLTAVSPSPRLTVPSGPHRVAVAKEGFVRWSRDVTVEPDQTTVADIVLVPSPEYVEAYERSATLYRIAAWSLTGLGAAATATGASLLVLQGDKRARLSRDIEDFNAGDVDTDTTRENLQRRINRVEQNYKVYQGVAFGGVAMLGAALYFWLAGDPPGKYREFGEGGVNVGFLPAAGGANASVKWSF